MIYNLSDHFTYKELTYTNHRHYLERNRDIENDHSYMSAAIELCDNLLEPIRNHFNSPVIIHSGYRCEALNKAIGGSKFSQHRHFQAADFHVVDETLEEVFMWVYKESSLEFGQLILEGWAVGQPTWIHISLGYPFRRKSKCGQILTMEAGKFTRVDK